MNVPSEWSFDPKAPMNRFIGPELAGKVLGIVGLGAIGSEISLRANAFRMKVITHDPYVSDPYIERFGAIRKPLYELMQQSDYIVIAARVRDDNKGMINEDYPFINLDNIILSPHIAGSSTDLEKYHSKMIVYDLSLAIQGKKPVNLYNPESWENSCFYKQYNL